MHRFRIILLLMTVTIFCRPVVAQHGFKESEMSPLHKLEGVWKAQRNGAMYYEEWKVIKATELKGKSFLVKSGVQKPLEDVRLYFTDGNILYVPTTAGQNDGKEVVFSLREIRDGAYIFENKAHDFPQIISYHLIGTDSLAAYIEGNINNQSRRINYNYKRDK